MNRQLKIALSVIALVVSAQAAAQVTFYEGEGFRGRVFATDRQVKNFNRSGYNDRASSVIVERGNWEVCADARFSGRSVVLRPGSYDSLSRMGLNNRISSVRQVDSRRSYDNEDREPLASPNYDYRRRPNERMYEARDTSVHAVMGSPEQRCWTEREQVSGSGRGNANVGGAIAGAVSGGILGHQVGSGRGNDIATVGGAVAGGAIGANVGRNKSNDAYGRDVRRCETVASDSTPQYWDVTYEYRGQNHRVQMTDAPGRTISVNRNGEPRG